MGMLATVLNVLFEGWVQMPPMAGRDVVSKGAEIVRAQVAENLRKAEEARRIVEERVRRECENRPNAFAGRSSNVRYKTVLSHPPADAIPDFSKKRPPDLRARELSFSARLVKHVQERCGGRAPLAYKRAGIDRKLYSKITADNWSAVSKQTALQFAIGLQLNRQETDEFLKSAGYSLSPTMPMDCVFAHCIDNCIWNILDVNAILVEVGLPAMDLHL